MMRRHAPTSSTSLHTLPARYTVPPLPPRIHRRLELALHAEGLILRPKSAEGDQEGEGSGTVGVLVRWGVKGKVQDWDGPAQEAVDLGGILGIVRLWDAAYLLVFLPPTKGPFPLFSSHLGSASLHADRNPSASSHHVFTLQDIHAIPLIPELASKSFARLQSIQAKRSPKVPTTPSKRGKWNLPLPGFNISGPGSVSTEELQPLAEDSEDESEGESDFGTYDDRSMLKSRESLVPEADETADLPPASIPFEDRAKKRFSLGWGKFVSKLGTPMKSKAGPNTAGPQLETKSTDVDPGEATPSPSDVLSGEDNATPQTTEPPVPSVPEPTPPKQPGPFASDPPQRHDLETKIIQQILREFGSGAFFYSHDFDLTHTLQHKRKTLSTRAQSGHALGNLLSKDSDLFPQSPSPVPRPPPTREDEDDFVEPDVQVPLWRRSNRRFFWNEFLMKDFIDLGLHSYIIPMMQGWVQSSSFSIPIPPNPLDPATPLGAVPVDLVVISRRSRDRAGLRYQRRGIDDEGHVANFVETEMLVRAKVEGKVSLFSFVQLRGSIPIKWSQSPYSMKPPPVLDQPVEQSFSVANLHFNDLTKRYGQITIINLSEQIGREAPVTNGYRDLVEQLARKDVKYVSLIPQLMSRYKDFDFHAKCHGMKWENIGELVEELDFGNMGYLWTLQGEGIREQSGAFRTNCIDCLDRTNVVQSALARHVLSNMLTQLGLIADPSTSSIESVFNDVWANNGDTLSLCYAHTSALKGDFVRTGKRDFSGMLHDGVSSISRMFYGAVSDFFAQAVISFFLGHRNLGVFSEFLENLQSSEESNLIKLSRVRAAAIETSSARVLSEGEQRVAGWTLLSPEDRNVKLSPKLEEKVLILTRVAIYVVSFNYSLEKVIGFTRIPLASLTSIQKGAYILSVLQEAGRDPVENAGFILNFSPANESTRYSTYSIRNKAQPVSSSAPTLKTPGTPTIDVEHAPINPDSSEFFAFKVLPREFITRGASSFAADEDDDAYADVNETCQAVVERIVRRIREQCKRLGTGDQEGFVVDKDVVR
ncbi:SacI homology domain-domain-containing protein [Naematelia encephala]|uniref:SacI homology domain-domain-containing protein n=1 Tax=Naematelia encephala TaxID=71784 RepID=A0A1Y2B9V4_9TREE|nr:SacI homology domain-domain-containing protein [Naematelia encephala]